MIADYTGKLSDATAQRKEYLEKSIDIVKKKRKENTTLINLWKGEPNVENNRYIGGISGSCHLANACQVTNCEIGSYKSTMVGGLIGYATRYDTLYRTFRYCNSGCVDSIVRGESEIGGLIGRLAKYDIRNCYSNATVIATKSDAGGIIGRYEKAAGTSYSDIHSSVPGAFSFIHFCRS